MIKFAQRYFFGLYVDCFICSIGLKFSIFGKKYKMNKITKIIVAIAICLGVGYSSSIVTSHAILDWYPTLIKPGFNPPNWIFAPVWTVLYIMMGVAAGLVWDRIDYNKETVK